MIVGIGIDVVEVARLDRALRRAPGLADRLFTVAEQGHPIRSLAGRFAAKEALAKALGSPPGLDWLDAEVSQGEDGEPVLICVGSVARRADALGAARLHVSISHDAGIASAVVVAEAIES